jgi:flavin-dependent dehydrogenase
MALRLARGGIETLVLEQARFPRDKTCGEFISPLGVRSLSRCGLLDKVLDAGAQRIERARIVLPSGWSESVDFAAPAWPAAKERAEDETPAEGPDIRYGLSLSRRKLDAICLQAAESAGATVRQGFRVRSIERKTQGAEWRIYGRDFESGPQAIDGDLLVGADGVGSVVARRLGWMRRAWPQRMGLTASFRTESGIANAIEMFLLPRAYCGAVDQGDGVTHVGLAIPHRKGERRKGLSPESAMREHLERFPEIRDRLKGAETLSPVKAFGPMAARSRRRYGERVLLIGDAAGFLDPVTGHGIGFALRSGELAAEAILSLSPPGDFSARNLAAYDRAYSRELGSLLRLYGAFQRVLALPPPVLHLMAGWVESHPGVARRLALPMLGLDGASRSDGDGRAGLSESEGFL